MGVKKRRRGSRYRDPTIRHECRMAGAMARSAPGLLQNQAVGCVMLHLMTAVRKKL